MATHAKITDVVKEDNAGHARRVNRFAKQGAHDHIRAPRLIHYCGAECIVFLAKPAQSFGQGACSKIRAATDHQARWFAARVRVDHANSLKLSCICQACVPFKVKVNRFMDCTIVRILFRPWPWPEEVSFGRAPETAMPEGCQDDRTGYCMSSPVESKRMPARGWPEARV